jgi:hypothetical protein
MFLKNTKYYIFILIVLFTSCNYGTVDKKMQQEKEVIDIHEGLDAVILLKRQKESQKRREFWKKRRDSNRRNPLIRKLYEVIKSTSLET